MGKMADDVMAMLDRKKAGMFALLENWAGTLEGYAKEYAPWTDRTANARQGLNAGAEEDNGKYTLYLSHGVEYGVWLETAHGGNYAIIQPTFDAHMSRIRNTVHEYWSD
jgi:hypothetical protein